MLSVVVAVVAVEAVVVLTVVVEGAPVGAVVGGRALYPGGRKAATLSTGILARMLATFFCVVVSSVVVVLSVVDVVVVLSFVVVDAVVLENRGPEGLKRLFLSELSNRAFKSGFLSNPSVVVSGDEEVLDEPLNLFSLCLSLSAASALEVVNLKEDGVEV